MYVWQRYRGGQWERIPVAPHELEKAERERGEQAGTKAKVESLEAENAQLRAKLERYERALREIAAEVSHGLTANGEFIEQTARVALEEDAG